MGQIMPPLFHRSVVYWLANLLGTGCSHRPFRFIKAKTRLFERQTTIIEKLADLGFRVGDDCLVLHLQHTPGQYLGPSDHQFDIVAIILADLAQVVGEVLAPGEQLFEAAETTASGWRRASMIFAFGRIR